MTPHTFFFFLVSCSLMDGYYMEPEQNMTLINYCLQESGVSMESVESFSVDTEKEPTEEIYCYLQCVFTGVGLIDEDGHLDVDLYKSMFASDGECLKKVPKIVKCSDMEAVVECEKE